MRNSVTLKRLAAMLVIANTLLIGIANPGRAQQGVYLCPELNEGLIKKFSSDADFAFVGIVKQKIESILLTERGMISNSRIHPPLLKNEWVEGWSGGRGQGRAEPGGADP